MEKEQNTEAMNKEAEKVLEDSILAEAGEALEEEVLDAETIGEDKFDYNKTSTDNSISLLLILKEYDSKAAIDALCSLYKDSLLRKPIKLYGIACQAFNVL